MKFDKSIFVHIGFLLNSLFLLACQAESDAGDVEALDETATEKYKVVCTVGMIADVVGTVAGDFAQVEGLIGEGVDPHLYRPTRSDVVKLSEADIVFYNGLLLEGKMTDVLVRIASDGKPVTAVTELVLEDTDYLIEKDDGSEYTDPHVWMDVSAWKQAVSLVAETLSVFDSENASSYKANAAGYIEKLEALDAYARESIASIPLKQRVLITAHDAFRYMGRAYGIEVLGIQGISTDSEAGIRDLKELVDFIVEQEIPAVFVETSVADKNVRALVEGARAGGREVVIGGSLFSDAMGEAGTYEGTYIGMIDHNVTTIANALGGEAEGFRSQ
ncbi:MAG: metal ABC transporter solute-binding protein, Zn/Mn family [Lentimonas sp.]